MAAASGIGTNVPCVASSGRSTEIQQPDGPGPVPARFRSGYVEKLSPHEQELAALGLFTLNPPP